MPTTIMALRVSTDVTDYDIRSAFDGVLQEGSVESIEQVGDEKIIRIAPGVDTDCLYEVIVKKGFIKMTGWEGGDWGYHNSSTEMNNLPGLLVNFEVRYAENNVRLL